MDDFPGAYDAVLACALSCQKPNQRQFIHITHSNTSIQQEICVGKLSDLVKQSFHGRLAGLVDQLAIPSRALPTRHRVYKR